MASLENFLIENQRFYYRSERAGERKLLTFLASNDTYVTSLTLKFAKACADAAGADVVIIPNILRKTLVVKLIKSFFPERVYNLLFVMFITFLVRFPAILTCVFGCHSGAKVLLISIEGVVVGPHIYDYLLTKCSVSSIDKVSLKMRFLIILELTYYFSSKRIIEAEESPLVLLPDNAYRQGMIFEYCKENLVECFAGLSMTEFSIFFYRTKDDYENHCRTPSRDLIERAVTDTKFKANAKAYLDSRTRGEGQQHDVIRAFSSQKRNINSASLIDSISISNHKPIVLVAAHIFRDAPHGYPNTMFRDYTDWLVQTCTALSKNENVNFIVKEHPSAELYNEQGEVHRVLSDIGLQNHLISSDINTGSLISIVDVLVTCGGTAGMEFACSGVPPLLAANPPYSKFGFTHNSNSIDDYLSKLRSCQSFGRLTSEQRDIALCSLYLINECLGARHLDQLIGTQRLFLGNTIDLPKFYGEMIDDCQAGTGYYALVDDCRALFSVSNSHFFNEPN